ncbi:glycosyltransferase [Patescibacteria group bacterium]|nr:glycosyltransferase [Patescibacteria group bacterium]
MKLLIVTQAVDSNHSNLGFFVRWIEEFAVCTDEVLVVANEVGSYNLPSNVTVLSLGKEHGSSRLARYVKFLSLIIWFSRSYDAVFCHMNPEYVIAGGWWWRLTGKRIVFWYMHKSVTYRLRLAEKLAHAIATASPESFRLPTTKLNIVGHGINTDLFHPEPDVPRGTHALSVGRLTKSKRHDKAIDRAAELGLELRIAGEGPERDTLEQYAHKKGARVVFLGGLTQNELRDEYLRAGLLIHTSETGSLDKVLLEAVATGTPIETEYSVYMQYAPQSYKVLIPKLSALCRK